MSELFPGLPPAPPPSTPRDAAAVILWRPGARGVEVFWVLRGAKVGFAGGFRAFPGGRLDAADALAPVPGLGGEAAALAACAAREVFEETGVLLARGAAALGWATRVSARRALLDGTATFAAFLAEHGLEIDAGRLAPAGRWLTPEALPLRYDARLFLARMPEGEEAEVWEGELVHGEFIAAAEALARWERGETLLHPPNLHAIRTLAGAAPDEALPVLRAPPRMDARSITDWVEFQRGVFYVPLRTPTLPPAAHTNAWILDVGGGVAVVDPGSPWPEEQAHLDDLLAVHASRGRPPVEVWLTHEHQDHVGGAAHLAGRLGLPLRAHAECVARLPAAARALARPLADGELLHGRWRALHTPGHARGHLVFHDERTGALLCGDLVSTLSTIVVDPPEGDMGAYLRSLERARALAPLRALYPAHGSPAPDAAAALDDYLAHRRARAAKVEAALAAGPATLSELTRRAYDDTPVALHGLAARSCLATLEWLAAAGRAARDGERWAASP
jgi:glyoxylase-like metal-dependent hydrolase (beta-lactamase superfamily II)/8-oxo-dGTP pyrophosphatase MutT (NUDIX family)